MLGGESFTQHTYIRARALGGDVNLDGQRVQGPDEEVVRVPPDDLVEESGPDAGSNHGRPSA